MSFIKFLICLFAQGFIIYYGFPIIHPNMTVYNNIWNALILLFAFQILGWIIRFLLGIFSLGISVILYYLTLGLTGLVINAFTLLLISKMANSIVNVPNFFSAFVGGILISLTSFIFGKIRE